MNIRYLQKLLSKIDEIKIIGKNSVINGVVCNVAAVVRYGLQLRLVILEFDENYQQQIEDMEIVEPCAFSHESKTNRIILKERKIKSTQSLWPIKNVLIGDAEFEVSGSEGRRLSIQDGESVLFLSELLRNGWNPEGVDYQNIDMIFLTSIEFIGEFNKIPDFNNNPQLHFRMIKDTATYLVEQPMTLTVNGNYPEKLWFKDKETGEEYWAQINRVYLLDMWVDMERTFSDPNLLKQMTKEQIDKAKKDIEESFLEICPKGMYYPIVEYECEECISLHFYSKNYLESKPIHSNRSIGFIVRPDKSTGILGMKLKSAIIQEPVPVDTVNIEAELFQYHKTTIPDDIIL